MKKKTNAFFWIISPTYKFAERNKINLSQKPDGKTKITDGIKKYNVYYLRVSIALILPIEVFFQLTSTSEKWKLEKYFITVFLGWLIFSRSIEIFKAFLDDAVEKLNGLPSTSKLNFGDRLRLAFNSYIELVISFGILYYILPSTFFKGSASPFFFENIFEAIYFSGVTMTTIGYGDISPANWFTQIMILFQVFCGLTLALVSFTVYTSLALSNPKTTDAEE